MVCGGAALLPSGWHLRLGLVTKNWDAGALARSAPNADLSLLVDSLQEK